METVKAKRKRKSHLHTLTVQLTEKEIEVLKKFFKTKSAQKAVEKAIKLYIEDEEIYQTVAAMYGVGGVKEIYD